MGLMDDNLCFGIPVIILPTCSMNPETAVTIHLWSFYMMYIRKAYWFHGRITGLGHLYTTESTLMYTNTSNTLYVAYAPLRACFHLRVSCVLKSMLFCFAALL